MARQQLIYPEVVEFTMADGTKKRGAKDPFKPCYECGQPMSFIEIADRENLMFYYFRYMCIPCQYVDPPLYDYLKPIPK